MKKILFLTLLASLSLITACDKDFGDLNVDKKNPSAVPPGALFANAQKALVDQMTTSNVNSGIFRLLAQNWTETTYTDEANYDLATRNIPQNFWNTMHLSVLKNLKESQALIPTQNGSFFPPAVQKNQDACVEILNVYTYSVLVLTFGDMPYSEALDVDKVYPKYDDDATIYADLLARLDRAISNISETEPSFGSFDLLYAGDMAGWNIFANSLKLRLGMILADADPTKAKSVVEAAAPRAIAESANNVAFKYLSAPPNTNPIWTDLIQSSRKDFVAANTIVDYMKGLSDPRIPAFFTVDASGTDYVGGIYAASNSYPTYSKPGDILTGADFESILIDYSEVEFLLAEAVERGFNVGGTAAAHYEAAIRASMDYWGVASADADAYLANAGVAYATAPGDWKAKIGNQKWLALYGRGGFDAWTEWRRLDSPTLNVPTDLTYADIPRRFTYPVQEQNLNTANYTAASNAIGGDVVQTKLFWDKF